MIGLKVLKAGPAVAIQDQGRSGYLAAGLTRSGAADKLALAEGAALLRQSIDCAVLEMAGMGAVLEATAPVRVALTGAVMRADIDGAPLQPNAAYSLEPGSVLTIGPVLSGVYGYLHVSGGFDTKPVLGARATHLSVGIGRLVSAGDFLPCREAPRAPAVLIDADNRLDGGLLRLVPSAQSGLFSEAARARFTRTDFQRAIRTDRQAIRLEPPIPEILGDTVLSIISEITTIGDIQIAGDGTPLILMAEGQTTGGYPRIGTVLPSDMPKAVQAPAGASVRFAFVSLEEGREIERRARGRMANLPERVAPLVRDPRDMADLMAYNLIDGMTTGKEA